MSTIQFIQVTPDQLQEQITQGVKEQLEVFLEVYKPHQPKEYVPIAKVAKELDVCDSTVWRWRKEGKLNAVGIGNSVFVIREDLEKALIPLNK